MLDNNLKVSIVIPCYNQAIYLSTALTSVLEQTYIDWECIIVDDGSADNPEEIANKFCTKDNRFVFYAKSNGGLSDARNFGIERASGYFILPLDADDKIGSYYLEKAIGKFQENGSISIVYAKAEFFGEKVGPWKISYTSYTDLLIGNSIYCSAIFKKRDWYRVSGYDVQLKTGFEDWDFWIRLLDEQAIVHQLSDVHFYYRVKKESMIISLITSKKKSGEAINYIMCKNISKYTEHFGALNFYLSSYQWLHRVHSRSRSNIISKSFYFLARRIAGIR